MNVFLIGFMGSGKSFIGKQLATFLSINYCDLDVSIEEKAGMSISQIFDQKGEAHFRQVEQEALHDTANLSKTIISTGGGAPCFFDNMKWMNQSGLTVYLETSATLLAQRLQNEMEHRPLLAHLSRAELIRFIEEKIAQRRFYYRQAQLIWSQNQENQSNWNTLGEKIRLRLSDAQKI